MDTDDVADADDIMDDSAVLLSKEAVCRASCVDGMTKSAEPSICGHNNHCMFGWLTGSIACRAKRRLLKLLRR